MNNLSGFLSFHGNVSGQMGSNLITNVEANPAGTPTEILTSIRVGDIIYSIPSGGGGGGGTNNYNDLLNKPKINNVVLSGDLSLSDLGIYNPVVMTGATNSSDGDAGYAPKPLIADKDKFLKGDGTWAEVSAGGFSQSLLYDSGSATSGAPFNQDVAFLDNLSNYDAIVIEWNTNEDRIRESPLEPCDTVFCTVQDALSTNFSLHFSGYTTRWGEITFTDTTFKFFERDGDLIPEIYKIKGLKF